MSPTRALILDCDGVLADTELDGHLVAFNQAFSELGHGISWTKEEYKAVSYTHLTLPTNREV